MQLIQKSVTVCMQDTYHKIITEELVVRNTYLTRTVLLPTFTNEIITND